MNSIYGYPLFLIMDIHNSNHEYPYLIMDIHK